jgi:ribonuclease D
MGLHYDRIENRAALDAALQELGHTKVIAIDLEFDKNRFRYGFNLCLMQLATNQKIYLIDPLADGVAIDRVFPLLVDASVKKIAFEFGEDLRLLHALGCEPNNLEDLSNASKLAGYSQLSLTNLVARVLDIDLGQGAQMSNWFQRPLTDKQCAYAADDVRYLFQLREALLDELKALGAERLLWYEEENAFFLKDAAVKEKEDQTIALSRDERDELNQVQYHVLKALYTVRRELAQKHNRPEFKIYSNHGLLSLAKSSPDNIRVQEKEIGLRSLRTGSIYEFWRKTVKDALKDAERCGLKPDLPAFLPLADEDKRAKRQEQKRINRMVEEDWKPIQSVLKQRFGQDLATFMLSNRTMKRLAAEEDDVIPNYRKELFDQIRAGLG